MAKEKKVPDYFERDLHKQAKTLWVSSLVALLGLGGCAGLVAYSLLNPNTALLVVGILFGVLMLWLLLRVGLLLHEQIKINQLVLSDDKEGLLAFEKSCYAHSFPMDKERHLAGLFGAYLDTDHLNEAKECLSKMKNSLLIEMVSPSRIELLLNERHYAEAKGLYLSFASRHRQGRSETEAHTVTALDGLFHSLEGKTVSEQEAQDLQDVLDAPVVRRLLASAPWDEKEREGEAVSESLAAANNAALDPLYRSYDVVSGSGDRHFQNNLNFFTVFSVLVFIGAFLAAVLSVPQGESRPLKNFWMMAFAAAFSLGVLIFAIVAKKKEPKDRTLPAIILSSVLITLSVILSLTAIA